MNIELKYFSGTGNSWKVLDTCKEVFAENNHTVTISSIKTGEKLSSEAEMTGFCFPVYAFGIPRICRSYLNQLEVFSKPRNVFVIITAGKKEESGFSVGECVKILRKKNCQVICTAVVEMPINWVTYMNPPSKDEARIIIREGIKEAQHIAGDILKGIHRYHKFNIPPDYGRWGLYYEYLLFKYLGVKNSWRIFKVYDSCTGCRLCSQLCPTGSIHMENGKPVWSSSCEQCMRCANYCPREAIYQTMGGSSKGRNRYHHPDFKPAGMAHSDFN
ncbi:MAG TPA: EFR1 family ferrodoxin [Bacteroidales bacterium]|nr:EFR1 family ferrodoxin [Bacteroidales bacterium]